MSKLPAKPKTKPSTALKAATIAPKKTAVKAASPAKTTPAKAVASKSKAKPPLTETVAAKKKANAAAKTPKSTPVPTLKVRKSAPLAKASKPADGPDSKKVKRARVPGDLASQYGERVKERKESPAAAERKARRDAEERAKIRAMMAPSDALIERLTRMGMVKNGAPIADELMDEAPEEDDKPVATRRPRKWEIQCGFCGRNTTHMGAAGLCACGAILVREPVGS